MRLFPKVPFSSPFFSIVRTTVMMIGELGYAEIFHNDFDGQELMYTGVTYAIFLIFCFSVGILLMNLLASSASFNTQFNKLKYFQLRL